MDAPMGTSVTEADDVMGSSPPIPASGLMPLVSEIIGSPSRLGLLSLVGPAADNDQSALHTTSPGIRVEEASLYSDEVEDAFMNSPRAWVENYALNDEDALLQVKVEEAEITFPEDVYTLQEDALSNEDALSLEEEARTRREGASSLWLEPIDNESHGATNGVSQLSQPHSNDDRPMRDTDCMCTMQPTPSSVCMGPKYWHHRPINTLRAHSARIDINSILGNTSSSMSGGCESDVSWARLIRSMTERKMQTWPLSSTHAAAVLEHSTSNGTYANAEWSLLSSEPSDTESDMSANAKH